jgi:hypothetical protein
LCLSNQMQEYFSQGMVENAIRPLLQIEESCAGLKTAGVDAAGKEENTMTHPELFNPG